MIFLWSPSWLVIGFCHLGAGFHYHTVRRENCTGQRATERPGLPVLGPAPGRSQEQESAVLGPEGPGAQA